jgi:hypothetical protein
LLQLQRTATLRHNFDGQVVLLNLLLRNYLHYNLYDQAEKLASKTEFLESKASTNEVRDTARPFCLFVSFCLFGLFGLFVWFVKLPLVVVCMPGFSFAWLSTQSSGCALLLLPWPH